MFFYSNILISFNERKIALRRGITRLLYEDLPGVKVELITNNLSAKHDPEGKHGKPLFVLGTTIYTETPIEPALLDKLPVGEYARLVNNDPSNLRLKNHHSTRFIPNNLKHVWIGYLSYVKAAGTPESFVRIAAGLPSKEATFIKYGFAPDVAAVALFGNDEITESVKTLEARFEDQSYDYTLLYKFQF